MLKKIVCLGLLVLFGLAATPKPVTLEWTYDYNTGVIPDLFVVYSSTNVNLPLTNWTTVTTVSGTNTIATFDILPGRVFFIVTASNYWSQEYSNFTNTPGLVSTNKLFIKR